MKISLLLYVSIFMILTSSCAIKKELESELAKNNKLELENETLLEEMERLALAKYKLENEVAVLSKLKNDTTQLGQKFRGEKKKNEDLNKLYDELVDQNKKLLSSSSREKQKLLSELEDKKRELLEIEQALNEQKVELDAREKKVQELQALVDKKDAAINDLKKRIEDALLNFDKEELTVEIRDGKLYVTMAEKLLFKSASAVVDVKGRDALTKLGEVLGKQTDIDILIEGHTDDDPIKTNCVKDNWDLSVLRATAIVRILQENTNIVPKRFIASGRGEFIPVASNETKEGKAKNRRTEIILAPRLDDIFKILESDTN